MAELHFVHGEIIAAPDYSVIRALGHTTGQDVDPGSEEYFEQQAVME